MRMGHTVSRCLRRPYRVHVGIHKRKVTSLTLTLWDCTQSLARWSWVTGIPYYTLWRRKRAGWSDARCLTTPPSPHTPRGDLG